jgi:Kdo2-lipid IVA lauroyltransferase/acyltransferase
MVDEIDDLAEPDPSTGFEGPRRTAGAWIEDRALAAALWVTSRAPWAAVDAFLGLLARGAHLFSQKRNRVARDFVRTALGPAPSDSDVERIVRGAYHHLFRVVVESERLLHRVPRESLLDHVELHLSDRARELAEAGAAVVVTTAHVGNWEVGSMVCERLGFRPFVAVAKPAKNHWVSLRIMRSREKRGIRVLPRRGAMAEAPQLVREGAALGLLLDQRARVKPVVAPFFGRPARCDRSAGVLIRRLGVPLVFVTCYRTGDPLRFEFHAETVLEPSELAGMNPTEVATRINAVFERMIHGRPEQYFWLHDRYRDAPPAPGA